MLREVTRDPRDTDLKHPARRILRGMRRLAKHLCLLAVVCGLSSAANRQNQSRAISGDYGELLLGVDNNGEVTGYYSGRQARDKSLVAPSTYAASCKVTLPTS